MNSHLLKTNTTDYSLANNNADNSNDILVAVCSLTNATQQLLASQKQQIYYYNLAVLSTTAK